MPEMITVEPAPALRVEFARWSIDFKPRIRTCSHNEFEVPADLLSEAPEELLIGAVVDGHRYRSPIEDGRLGITPPGTWPGPEEVSVFAPLEDARADEPEVPAEDVAQAWHCDACGREFGTQRGLNKHRTSAHPEEKL